MLFEGAIADIPEGWMICDGNNGTPDLRNNFVVQSGDTYNPDDTGGATTHDHGFTGDGHIHGDKPGVDLDTAFDLSGPTTPQSASGTVDVDTSIPPYYALAYVMKT